MKNIKDKNILTNRKTIILFISFFLFMLLTFNIFSDKINTIDSYISNLILNIRNDHLTNILIIITNISSAYSLIAITVFLIIVLKNKKTSLLITINLIFSFFSSQLVKLILRRDRPVDIDLVETLGFSYPSGHSMVSMAFFGYIAYLIYKKTNKLLTKIILFTLLFLIISLIGFSRIYLGVHYFSDVIGGFLLAATYLMFFITISTSKHMEGKK